MPNWCSVNLRFKHKTEADAEKFASLVNEWAKPVANSDFGDKWLVNYAVNSGIAKYEEKGCVALDGSEIFARGSAYLNDTQGNEVHIYEESAWEPALKIWRLILEKHFPECEIEYWAEECGCGLYATNDPWLVGTYEIDVWDEPEWFKDAEPQHELSFEEMRDFVNKFCKSNLSSEKDLLAKAGKTHGICVNKWEEMSVGEFN